MPGGRGADAGRMRSVVGGWMYQVVVSRGPDRSIDKPAGGSRTTRMCGSSRINTNRRGGGGRGSDPRIFNQRGGAASSRAVNTDAPVKRNSQRCSRGRRGGSWRRPRWTAGASAAGESISIWRRSAAGSRCSAVGVQRVGVGGAMMGATGNDCLPWMPPAACLPLCVWGSDESSALVSGERETTCVAGLARFQRRLRRISD